MDLFTLVKAKLSRLLETTSEELANKRSIDWIGPLRNYAFPLVVSRQFFTFATAAWPQGRALALLLRRLII